MRFGFGLGSKPSFVRGWDARRVLCAQRVLSAQRAVSALVALGASGCDLSSPPEGSSKEVVADEAQQAQGPLPKTAGAAPRIGMVYIPPGALVVGTPRDVRPRRPDRELGGEQVMLEGYYIDQLAYPNEDGAIPITNVSLAEARALCEAKGKRLCSELEWERACKGPDNRLYEYGDVYHDATCRTGRSAELRPSGYLVGCQSDFGVRDLHGGPFEWTSSDFGRKTSGLQTIRGGNGTPGEVFGRCANAESANPEEKSGTVGFRCCAGPESTVRVDIGELSAPGLFPDAIVQEASGKLMLERLAPEVAAELSRGGSIKLDRSWVFIPVPNERLVLFSACGRGKPKGPSCGLVAGRVSPGKIEVLGFAGTGQVAPMLHRPGPREMIWIVGADLKGATKRLLSYRYGDVVVSEMSRGAPKKAPRVK